MDDEKRRDALQHLAQRNRDAAAGLRSRANQVDNSELETVFAGFAKQHERFASELVAGAEVAEDHPHSGWENFKALFQGHGPTALLQSVQDIEQSLESAYLDTEESLAQGKLHTLLVKQREQIQQWRTRVARLIDEADHGVEFQANK